MSLIDLDRPKITEYIKSTLEERHNTDPTTVHKKELSSVDYINNTFAQGFSKNLQLGETKFVGINENTYIYPEQFTSLGIQNRFPDTDAVGFTKNMMFRESKFVGIEDNSYTYPDTLGLGLGNIDFADYMDGIPQGRGFISPGGHPKGFTPNMTDTMFMSEGHTVSLNNMNITISNYTLSNDSWVPNTLSIPIQDTRRFYPPNAGTFLLNARRRYPAAIHLGPLEHLGLSLADSAIADRYIESVGEDFTGYEDLMRNRERPIDYEWGKSPAGRSIAKNLPGLRMISDLGLLWDSLSALKSDPKLLLSRQAFAQLSSPNPNTRMLNPLIFAAGGRTTFFKVPRSFNISSIKSSFVDTLNELQGLSPSRYGVYERFEGYDFNRDDTIGGSFNTDTVMGLLGQGGEGAKEEGRRNKGNKLYQWTTTRFIDEEGGKFTSAKKEAESSLAKSFGSIIKGVVGNIVQTQIVDKAEDLISDAVMAVTGERHGVPSPPTQYVKSQKKLYPDGEKVNVGENKGGGKSNYASLDYSKLGKDKYRYETSLHRKEGDLQRGVLSSGGVSQNMDDNTGYPPANLLRTQHENKDESLGIGQTVHTVGKRMVDQIGNQGLSDSPSILAGPEPHSGTDYGLGLTSTHKSSRVDKINLWPISTADPNTYSAPGSTTTLKDFIKFRFKDVVNGNYLVFRAILSGINDNITPEWTGEQYIGRADKVYVYNGAERNVSFNFAIYPKSKVELPTLIEKLNYLMSLCYPKYDPNNGNRMVAPFIQLTIGDILKDSPGFLNSLSYTVEETSTWEIQDGLQFPKYINVSCDFKYIGKDLPERGAKLLQLNKPKSKEHSKLTLEGLAGQMGNAFDKFEAGTAITGFLNR